MRLAMVLTLGCLLSACATEAKYKTRLATWIDHDADELVQSWGPPGNSYTMGDGKKILAYADTLNSSAITHFDSSTGMGFTSAYVDSCTTEFMVSVENKIEAFRFKGSACRSE